MVSVFIDNLNSDIGWTPQTQRKPLQGCISISMRVFFLFFYCVYSVCAHWAKTCQSTSTTKIVFHYIEVLRFSFIRIHTSRRERQRTRWPCVLKCFCATFFSIPFSPLFFSLASLYRKCQSLPNPRGAKGQTVVLSKEETTWLLILRG